MGTYDPQSKLFQLQGMRDTVLRLIIMYWAWPEMLVNSARLWEPSVLVDEIIAEMIKCNPGVTEANLRVSLVWNDDGSIRDWDMAKFSIRSLPELFGAVRTTGDLRLDNNQLSSLPDSFGLIEVGGALWLYNNQLSSLPDSFGSIKVGADLHLDNNQLSSLPDSFGSIVVARNLYLNGNQLSSLPGSFVSINVGGGLQLQDNALQEIPESFPNVYGPVWTT